MKTVLQNGSFDAILLPQIKWELEVPSFVLALFLPTYKKLGKILG